MMNNISTQNEMSTEYQQSLRGYCQDQNISIKIHTGIFTNLKKTAIGIATFIAITTLALGILASLHVFKIAPWAQWGLIGGGVLLSFVALGTYGYNYNKHKPIKVLLNAFAALESKGPYDTDFAALMNNSHPRVAFMYRNSFVREGNELQIDLKVLEVNIELQGQNPQRLIHIFANQNEFEDTRNTLYNRNFAFLRDTGNGYRHYFANNNQDPF